MAYLTEYLFPKTLNILNDILEDSESSDYKLMRAIDEIHKLIRAVLPKQIESRSFEIQARVELSDRRQVASELLDRVRDRNQLAYEVLKEVMLEQE